MVSFLRVFNKTEVCAKAILYHPILFNIAFDPFLKSLANHTEFTGFQFQISPTAYNDNESTSSLPQVPSPPPLKLLAYADDVVIFCKTQRDFDIFMAMYQQYSLASNATLNRSKTVAQSKRGSTICLIIKFKHGT
jgi:hypothetical protein